LRIARLPVRRRSAEIKTGPAKAQFFGFGALTAHPSIQGSAGLSHGSHRKFQLLFLKGLKSPQIARISQIFVSVKSVQSVAIFCN
jgi:hypothetical protein